jgi:hypothetical protein
MVSAMYFRRQAEVLLALSRATIDLMIAARLRALAAEFRAKADELDAEEQGRASWRCGATARPGDRPGSPPAAAYSPDHVVRSASKSCDRPRRRDAAWGVEPIPRRFLVRVVEERAGSCHVQSGRGLEPGGDLHRPRTSGAQRRDAAVLQQAAGFVGAGGEHPPARGIARSGHPSP